MPLYMSQVAYTPEHLSALTKEPQDRTEAISALAQKFGCRLISFYYSFGEYDGVVIVDAPNETAVTALLLAALGGGHIRATKTSQLLSPRDAMEAMRQAGTAAFKAPGGGR
jgi:uncharacterized protein with GYD domain